MRLLPAQLPAVKAKPDEGETQEEHEYQDVIRLGQPSGEPARRGEFDVVLAEALEILEALQQQLMAPDLVSKFVRTFNDEINRARRERDHRRNDLKHGHAHSRCSLSLFLDQLR